MISAKEIYEKAEFIKAEYETANPIELISSLNIKLFFNHFESLLGMYTFAWEEHIIILNLDLDENLKNMVAAHELGHYVLHSDEIEDLCFTELNFDWRTGTLEYEANAFASHLLIPNDEFLTMATSGLTIQEIACNFSVDPNLVKVKANELNRMGFHLKNIEELNSCFLKDAKQK